MSTIDWASGISGTFTTAADWVGGVVPGSADTAVINATSSSKYTVTLNSAVTLAGLVLDQKNATLFITGGLTAPSIQVEAGLLEMQQASLAGTFGYTGGTVEFVDGSTNFTNVTWQGAFDPLFLGPHGEPMGTLTIDNGITLTGAGGTGPGSASFEGAVILDDVSILDNASITSTGTLSFNGVSTLTFGTGLDYSGQISISTGQTLVNNGIFTNPDIGAAGSSTATFINNGTVDVTLIASLNGAAIFNNGEINVSDGGILYVMPIDYQTPGAGAGMALNGGNLYFYVASMTTADLLAFYAAQNVSGTGAYGFNTPDLDNTGATLNIGAGTTVGTLAVIPNADFITITGGTVIDHGGDTTLKVNFSNLTYESAVTSVNLYGNLTNTIMKGVDSITVGTLSTTASDTLTLNGANITNAAGKHKVDFSVLGNTGSINELVLNGAQSTNGFTITLNQAELGLTGGVDLSHAKLIVPSGTGGYTNMLKADSGGDTLGTGFVLTQQANSDLAIVGGASTAPLLNEGTLKIAGFTSLGNNTDGLAANGYLTNSGRIAVSAGGTFAMGEGNSAGLDYGYLTNSGTISVSHGYLQLDVSNLVNTGSISVSHGTLALGGSLTVSSLTEFSHPGSALIVNGELDLASQTVTLGTAGVPAFSLAAGPTSSLGNSAGISDGTFVIKTGATFDSSGNYLDITANLVNDGTYAYSGGAGNEQTIAGAISGSGEIALDSAQIALGLGGTVGSGQTIAFLSTDQTLALQTGASQSGFAGTLTGFAAGDSIAIVRQSASVSLTGGSFVGDSIVATLSTGATIALATSSALTGSLTLIDNSQTGTDTLTYAAPAARDWSLPRPDQASGHVEVGGAFRPSEQGVIDIFLPLHTL